MTNDHTEYFTSINKFFITKRLKNIQEVLLQKVCQWETGETLRISLKSEFLLLPKSKHNGGLTSFATGGKTRSEVSVQRSEIFTFFFQQSHIKKTIVQVN